MPRFIAALAASLTTLAVLSGGVLAVADPADGSAAGAVGAAYVDTAIVRSVGDRSSPAELVITGSLPTPCHELAWEVEYDPDATRVWLWSWPGEGPCAAVLEPFELSIPLVDIAAGSPVLLESEPVPWSRDEPTREATRLTGAGWSFGMCLGYCAADLELSEQGVVMRGRDRDSIEPVFVNRGRLTAEGQSRVSSAVSSLDGSALDPVYGCPDCADGGAAYLRLEGVDGESRHEMEYGAPPEVLAELYGVAMSLSHALESCTSNGLISVAGDCVPYIRPSA